ncbi:MAG: hypothetical protein ACJAUD_000265 [Crocinitomicaceae bacterium]|jgi:hypothetical protein
MKRTLQKVGLIAITSIFAGSAWAQCPVVNCPTEIVVSSDSTGCGATITYTAPEGNDPCNTVSDTFNFSGIIDSWVVPAGVTFISIEARGAEGSNNTGSTIPPGLGATMTGDFTVTPGETISILVGQQYATIDGNGGGGGSFVVDALNNPLVIAGGGGGSAASEDSPDKHGQVVAAGGTGAGGGGLGGTSGSGGAVGAAFASGAGGGLLTNGADGWTPGSGGFAFVNGGAGANVGYGIGGFGGGGNGSGNVVGGGGGGYSGGGSGSNSTGGGVGGGGGSINNGTNQVNTGGDNSGNGMVIITYGGTTTTTFESGLGSGTVFPVGTSVETFSVVNAFGDSAWCSFNVTVYDSIVPTIADLVDVSSCDPVVNGLAATTYDNCTGETVSYNMIGATTGSGSGDANGMSFNVGTTTVWYIVSDASGNQDSTSFDVVINALPAVAIDAFPSTTVCIYNDPITLPAGTPAGGTYSGLGVTGFNFDPASAGNGAHWITYSYTDSLGCMNSDSTEIIVDACAGIDELPQLTGFVIYPNPSEGVFNVEFENSAAELFTIEITDVNGRSVYNVSTQSVMVELGINISEEARGVYFMNITSESHKVMQRIVKN